MVSEKERERTNTQEPVFYSYVPFNYKQGDVGKSARAQAESRPDPTELWAHENGRAMTTKVLCQYFLDAVMT